MNNKPVFAVLLVVLALVLALAPSAAANPRIDYLLYCGGCHLENGSGDPPEVPDLRADVDRIVSAPGGRAFMAQVPGSAQAPFSDAKLAGVLNYIVTEFNPELATFEPFTAEEIAGYRGGPLLDPGKRRAQILGD